MCTQCCLFQQNIYLAPEDDSVRGRSRRHTANQSGYFLGISEIGTLVVDLFFAVPAKQVAHTVFPGFAAEVPAGHGLHDDAPSSDEYDPAAQSTHELPVKPESGCDVPGGQSAH